MTVNGDIGLQSVLRRHDDLLVQPIDDDVVMADMKSGVFFGLADSGKRIWDLLESPTTPAAICEALMSRYDVDRDACETEVLAFLRELHGEGLVRLAG